MTVIQQVAPSENEEETLKEMHRLFNDQGHSDYVVVYLRLITSGQLQEGAEFYQNFIDGHCTMEEFRHQEVEPMYKESDHIHIIGEWNQVPSIFCANLLNSVDKMKCTIKYTILIISLIKTFVSCFGGAKPKIRTFCKPTFGCNIMQ